MSVKSASSRSSTPTLNSHILPLLFHSIESTSSVCIVHLRTGKKKFTDARFLEQFSDLREHGNFFKGSLLIMDDFKFQFDQPSNTRTHPNCWTGSKLSAFLSLLQQQLIKTVFSLTGFCIVQMNKLSSPHMYTTH